MGISLGKKPGNSSNTSFHISDYSSEAPETKTQNDLHKRLVWSETCAAWIALLFGSYL